MDFQLSEEHEAIQRTAREFATRSVAPIAAEIDKAHRYPKELVDEMGELGFMGIEVDPEWDGAGLDPIAYVIAMEEISAACASTGVIMSVNNSLVCDPLRKWANDEQKDKWLRPLAAGEKLGCFMLSEPEAGSDAAAQKTVAEEADGGFVINGVKNWITNGPQADTGILMCMTDKSKGHRGISSFIIDMNGEGVSRGPKDDKLGIRASHSCQIFFTDHFVSQDQLLGNVGDGFKVAMSTLDCGRIGIAAQALGIARGAFEAAARYSTERKTFGKPIAKHQAISFMLADMATQIDAARLLTYRAAALKAAGKRHS
ncbi:MAG: acyl-CoA dehydrogenase family protein, partial [Myxococcales bacterium]|nr:acyl-CoA dehydrogenase family protein [Myxococcales bacterium]